MNKYNNKNMAFTLIELLSVIVILGIILVIAVPNVLNIINKSKHKVRIREAIMIIDSAKKYMALNDTYKSTIIKVSDIPEYGEKYRDNNSFVLVMCDSECDYYINFFYDDNKQTLRYGLAELLPSEYVLKHHEDAIDSIYSFDVPKTEFSNIYDLSPAVAVKDSLNMWIKINEENEEIEKLDSTEIGEMYNIKTNNGELIKGLVKLTNKINDKNVLVKTLNDGTNSIHMKNLSKHLFNFDRLVTTKDLSFIDDNLINKCKKLNGRPNSTECNLKIYLQNNSFTSYGLEFPLIWIDDTSEQKICGENFSITRIYNSDYYGNSKVDMYDYFLTITKDDRCAYWLGAIELSDSDLENYRVE